MANRWRNNGNSDRLYFSWAPKSLQMVTAAMKLKDACSLEEKLYQPKQHIKKQRYYFANKSSSIQSYCFSSSHVQTCMLDHKESWAPKNWCFWILVLGTTLESPLDRKEIQQVSPKGSQSWISIGRTEAEMLHLECWSWNYNTLDTWCKELTHCKRPWYQERLKAGGEGDNWGWDCWMASLTWWTWIWGSSGSWWWTGKPGMLQSMGLQRVRHDWATELNWEGRQTWRCHQDEDQRLKSGSTY